MKIICAMLDRASKMPPSLKKVKMLKDAKALLDQQIALAVKELKS